MVQAQMSFFEFGKLLSRFRDGDDLALPLLESAQFEWSPVVDERLTSRCVEAFERRLQKLQIAFAQQLVRGLGQVDIHGEEMLALKAQFGAVARFTRLPYYPVDLRESLIHNLTVVAGRVEESLRKIVHEQKHPDLDHAVSRLRMLDAQPALGPSKFGAESTGPLVEGRPQVRRA